MGLPVFIHFCVHASEELRRAVFTLPYMGFYEQWAQGFPQSQINTINDVYTHTQSVHMCMHMPLHTHTLTQTALCHAPYQAFKTSPICAQLSPLSVKWNVNVHAT